MQIEQIKQRLAALGAGPGHEAHVLRRWLQARPALDPDFWIETVPYKETREYIPRVLAFSVIYDWRLQQPVVPIGRRLLGDFSAFKPAVMKCPAPAAGAAPSPQPAAKAKKRR